MLAATVESIEDRLQVEQSAERYVVLEKPAVGDPAPGDVGKFQNLVR